jgi:hypothetical protein
MDGGDRFAVAIGCSSCASCSASTGATLVGAAVDVAHCTRCSAPAIESYLKTLI